MKNLKDLTKEECIKIACIAFPTINWKFIQSKEIWDGFDLIDIESNENEYPAYYIFQIDYRAEKELNSKSRFRFYQDLNEYTIDGKKIEEILNYISTL